LPRGSAVVFNYSGLTAGVQPGRRSLGEGWRCSRQYPAKKSLINIEKENNQHKKNINYFYSVAFTLFIYVFFI